MEGFSSGKDSGSITFKKSTLWKAGTFVFAALLVISIFTGGFRGAGSGTVTGGTVNIPDIPTELADLNAEDL